jgi:hypothetical protein
MKNGGHRCPPSFGNFSRYGRIVIEKPGAGLGL